MYASLRGLIFCVLKNINSFNLTTGLFNDTFSLRSLYIRDTVQQVSLDLNEYTTEFLRLVGDVVLHVWLQRFPPRW